jgi:hypothetical protein
LWEIGSFTAVAAGGVRSMGTIGGMTAGEIGPGEQLTAESTEVERPLPRAAGIDELVD